MGPEDKITPNPPADALRDAALQLALDIVRMDGASDVLDC
jgi:hypothetical protein